MRIAVLSRNFSVRGGGAERYAVAVAEQLAKSNDVHVYAQNFESVLPGVQYHKIACPTEHPRWINQIYFAWATWRATRTGFDVVHSHENTWHGNVQTVHVLPVKHNLFAGLTGWTRLLRWIKVLTSPRLIAYLWLEAARYRFASRKKVVLTSTTLRTVMEQTYPAAKGMMTVIPPGVSKVWGSASAAEQLAARKRLGLPECGPLLLFVGNDFRRKGLPTLLEAMALMPGNVQLAVAGESTQLAEMRAIAANVEVDKRVYFMGSLPDLDDAYRAADGLVHPTLEDTYAMVVLEAMAHGLPVVVSDANYCGIAAELRHGTDAYILADPTSVQAIAKAITTFVLSSVGDVNGQVQALNFARQHQWIATASAYEATMHALIQRPKQRWLVLAHAFNMDGRAASQTITDKIPHLRAAGIELVVLSGVSGTLDTVVEHHQLWPALPAGIKFELRHVLRKRLGSGFGYRTVMGLCSFFLLPGMFLEKLFYRVESSWSWWISAYLVGRRLARKEPFDLIYSTGGAFAAHMAGRALKRATSTPWLAEVHDPMVTPCKSPTTPQEKMQAAIEHAICKDADIAIWFTDQALASARMRHPQLGARGKMMLPGIDAPFQQLPPYTAGKKLVVGHFGSLSSTRNLGPFITALESLRTQGDTASGWIELHVYGGPLDSVSAGLLERSPVGDHIKHFGRIEVDPLSGVSGREQILRRMRSVDVLLLLHGNEPICAEYIPSKLYEYLWMQRPILALVHDNPQMENLIRSMGHHVVTTHGFRSNGEVDTSVVDVVSATQALYRQWRLGGLPDNELSSPYTTAKAVSELCGWVRALRKIGE